MRGYLITARPNRWQRAVRSVRLCMVRTAGALVMVLAAVPVLVFRIARPVIDVIATGATYMELWLSLRLNLPPLGSLSGRALAWAFFNEFRNVWTNPTTTSRKETGR